MRRVWSAAVVGLLLGGAPGASAQTAPRLTLERGDGSSSTVTVRLDRGYASVPISVISDLGWTVAESDGGLSLSAADEITVSMRLASPFFRWDGIVLQMTDPPYRLGAQTYVPLQFLTDFLPRRLPGLYDFDGERALLRAGDVTLLGEGDLAAAQTLPADRSETGARADEEPRAPAASSAVSPRNSAEAVRDAGPSVYDGVRVVVIDPGHGGEDPGALGPDGLREKDIALAIGLRVADELRDVPGLEVHLIRDDDTFVDVWERGQIATDLKGERPGVFVSIHANSFPPRRQARGFETYFLSDARTEHERRVSAIENAPITMNPDFADEEQLADLDFILRDLKNYEHAHWSADLAGLVQDELDDVHPGPNRGVKQGVLAVLTNALMPSVLIEIGYLSNETEAKEIGDSGFHDRSAAAIGDAVVRFFERYPPGTGGFPGGR
jgi:N-acetylmuramoyl-L-alanine amidase